MKVYKMRFRSSLHVSSDLRGQESADEIVHSDTLVSALIYLWPRLYGDDPAEVMDSLRLTSAFPFIGETLYFPRPCNFRLETSRASTEKQIKKVTHLSEGLFRKSLEGPVNAGDLEIHNVSFASLPREISSSPGAPIGLKSRTRAVIDRENTQATPFNFAEVEFAPGNGLWFGAEDSGLDTGKLTAVVRLLGDEGLGADRSVGMGQFDLEETEIELPAVKGDGMLTLSLFCPEEAEIDKLKLGNSYYRLVERGGWISGTSLRKVSARFFAEGACFPTESSPLGRVIKLLDKMPELGLDHQVLRSGKPVAIPIRMEG